MIEVEHKGWRITTYDAQPGVAAKLTRPDGKHCSEPIIHVSTHEQAQNYARRCINWLIRVDSRLSAERR